MKFTQFFKDNAVIQEALNDMASGENFKLKSSSIDDDHIKKTIELYAKTKNMRVEDARAEFKLRLDKQIKGLGKSIINKNGVENAADSVAFKLISELDVKTLDLSAWGIKNHRELLDRDLFYDLTQYVLGENSQFFPLRNPFEKKAVRPYFFITPDHLARIKDPSLKQSAATQCDTAFCTPNAEMVFNRVFTEQLAISALLNNVKPKSKKYVNNGGDIPDHYAYLEFVIMHELLHFSAGDHFYTKQMVKKIHDKHPEIGEEMAQRILNYVGDYINNWQLAKSGYEQLPIGLFSEDINYDKFGSYEDIIEAVIEEMKKLSPEDQQEMTQEMEKGMDEHVDNEDDAPSQGGSDSTPQDASDQGKGQPQSQQDPGGEDGQGSSSGDEDGEPGQGSGQPGDSGDEDGQGSGSGQPGDQGDSGDEDGQGSGSGQPGDQGDQGDQGQGSGQPGEGQSQGGTSNSKRGSETNPDAIGNPDNGGIPDDVGDAISKAIDDAMRQNNKNVDKRDDGNNDAQSALDATDDYDVTKQDIAGKNVNGAAKLEFKEVQTSVNWKKMLKKMMPSGDGDIEDTYSKMSRQATSSMVTAQQTGAGRISPGETMIDSDKKGLVFIIDNSGSVMSIVNSFNQEILQLVKKNKKLLDNMFVIKFSSTFEVFKVDVNKFKYSEIMNVKEIVGKKPKLRYGPDKSLNDLFKATFAMGTEYTNEMHKVIEFFHEKNMNLIMFTDDDLVRVPNTKKYFNLSKKRKNSVAMFLTDERSHKNMSATYGSYRWMTVLK